MPGTFLRAQLLKLVFPTEQSLLRRGAHSSPRVGLASQKLRSVIGPIARILGGVGNRRANATAYATLQPVTMRTMLATAIVRTFAGISGARRTLVPSQSFDTPTTFDIEITAPRAVAVSVSTATIR